MSEGKSQSYKILAIDPGTKCGWAHSDGASGVWDLSIRPDESTGMRLIRFCNKLKEIKDSVGIDIVVYEAARNLRFGHAVRSLAELQGVLQYWCINNNIEYIGYSPTEIKKFATGSGRSDKTIMLEQAKKRWPNISDANEADALWILAYAKYVLGL